MSAKIEHLADPALFATVLRVMTPLLLAALGVLISDRAGVFNIGMEGMMLVGALTGVLVSAGTGSAWLGLGAAIVLCGAVGCLMAFVINGLGANLIITGIALNLAASSATTLGLFFATGDKGMSGSLKSGVLPSIRLPVIDGIPVLGPLLSGHHILTWFALFAVPLVSLLVMRTPFGLQMRAVGVAPKAAAAAGIPVARVRTLTYVIQGLCVAVACLLYIPRLGSTSATTGLMWELQAITAVVVGGTALRGGVGRIWGTICGAFILEIVGNIMLLSNFVSEYLLGAIQGAIIIIAMLVQRSLARR